MLVVEDAILWNILWVKVGFDQFSYLLVNFLFYMVLYGWPWIDGIILSRLEP